MSDKNQFRRRRPDRNETASAKEQQIADAGADPVIEPAPAPARRRAAKEPTKDFGTPLTKAEYDLLDEVADIADQSRRKMARRLLVKAMEDYIKENG